MANSFSGAVSGVQGIQRGGVGGIINGMAGVASGIAGGIRILSRIRQRRKEVERLLRQATTRSTR